MHITGGGGELGPASRTPEAKVAELIEGGLTTVVGVLGTDCISRSLENLVVKCRALNDEGITAFMWTGVCFCLVANANVNQSSHAIVLLQ